MAYKSEDIQKVVKQIERDSGAVKISEILDKDTNELKSVDIRYYFEDKITGELKPTQKGVRIGVDEFPELMSTLKEIANEFNLAN